MLSVNCSIDRHEIGICQTDLPVAGHGRARENRPIPVTGRSIGAFLDLRCLASLKYVHQPTNIIIIQTLKEADSGATFSHPLFYNNLTLPVAKVVFIQLSYNYFVLKGNNVKGMRHRLLK